MISKIVGSVLTLVPIGVVGLVLSVAVAGAADRSPRGDGQGSKIAFTRLCDMAGCSPSVEHQHAEIWVMNGDGSDPKPLTSNSTWDLGAVWSPNGKTVAFYGVQYDPNTDKPLGTHVYLINADRTDQRLLMPDRPDQSGRWPSFSPDGKKIAFDDGNPQKGDIWVVNSDGTDPQNLTNNAKARNIRPDWSPDGQKIAFVSQGEIYVMKAELGSPETCLTCRPDGTNDGGTDNAPAWSPNGQKIAFQSSRDGYNEIYVMNADGSDETRLTNDPANNEAPYPADNEDPSWSPNGQQITFHRDIDPPSSILEVYVMNADGSDVTALTGLPSENGHPGWGRGPALTS